MRGLEMTRIETFTDAAFAFALTLLVISFDPPTTASAMLASLRDAPAFLLSGTMLMMFWWGHHQWSRRFGLDDAPTFVLSCVLVFTVLIYVYPLRFMFGMMMTWIGRLSGLPLGSGELRLSIEDVGTVFVVYGTGFVFMCVTLVLLNLHAWRQRNALQLTPCERHDTISEIGAWVIVMAAGLLSVATAALTPPHLAGLAGWAYAPLGPVMPVFSAWRGRSRARIAAAVG